MDRVRFGRALGYGARHAAKSLAKAADAAAAPNPSRAATSAGAASGARARAEKSGAFPANTAPESSERTAAPQTGTRRPGGAPSSVAGRVAQARDGVRQGKSQAGHLRRHVWSPLAKFSNVVGLQVSGTFFALVATFLSKGLWKTRGAVHLGLASTEAEKLYLHAAAFLIFAYFAVSSFVRAHLKQRR